MLIQVLFGLLIAIPSVAVWLSFGYLAVLIAEAYRKDHGISPISERDKKHCIYAGLISFLTLFVSKVVSI